MRHRLVLARLAEDVSWVAQVPPDFDVFIYNKGEPLDPIARQAVTVTARPQGGREAETYLYHLFSNPNPPEGYTVFSQADPFDHAPNFIELLGRTELWLPVQPLSCQWIAEKGVPPADVLARDNSEYIDGLPVRSETFSVYSMAPLHFYEWGAYNVGTQYRDTYNVPASTNISEHFLRKCGLADLADGARDHLIGRFAYGGIFAVRGDKTDLLPRPLLETMRQIALEPWVAPYLFEKHWLHLFGLPFLFRSSDLPIVEPVAC